MKQIISFLVFIMLFETNVSGQTFALYMPDKQEFTTYTPVNFMNNKEHGKRVCTVTKVGIISMGVGLIVMGLGLNVALEAINPGNTHAAQDNQEGTSIFVVGVIMLGAGAGMTIGGCIHDFTNRHKQRFSVIAPKRNQLGLAYNF